MSNTPILDIIIPDVHSPLLLGIGDISYYPTGFSIVNPSIEITAPNSERITLPFTAQNFAVFNSNDLKLTCDVDPCDLLPLPDGIWEVKYSIAPSTTYCVTKKFLRVFNLLRRFEIAFMNVELMECSQQVKKQNHDVLDQIEYYIQGAIATANDCNYTKAMDLYREADKMLNLFLKTKC